MSLTISTPRGLLPLLVLAALLLLSCLASLTSAQSGRADYSAALIAFVTSNGACQDVFPYAWNCTIPVTLTFTLTQPLVPVPSYAYFLLDGQDSETYTYASLLRGSNTSYSGVVTTGGYALGLMGRPLAVSLYDMTTGNRSAPFVGVSFALLPPPTFASIGGCVGSGQATSQCLPENDTVTFTGSGFSIFAALRVYYLLIGATTLTLGPQTGTAAALQVVNDSYATLTLSAVYANLPPSQYGGTSYPLFFNLQWRQLTQQAYANYYTNALAISFAPLPPPRAAVASSTTCTVVSATSLVNCLPGAQAGVVVMTGHYLATAAVSLSASGRSQWAASPLSPTSVRLAFVLPIIPEDTAGQAWDVTVSTSAGSLVFPGLITFSTSPYIAVVGACRDTGADSIVPNCAPNSTLTLVGDHFVDDPLLQVQLGSVASLFGGGVEVNVSCPAPTFVSSTLVTCVVPALNATLSQLFYGVESTVQVLFPSTGQSTNAFSSRIVAWPDSPVLTSVSGCEASNGSLALVGCRGGDVITVTGSDLLFYTPNITPNTNFGEGAPGAPAGRGLGSCTMLPGSTASLVQCRLSYLDATNSPAQPNVQYKVNWYGSNPGYSGLLFGNVFYIAFTFDAPAASAPTTSSSSSNTMAILVGVLVPVLLLVVGVTAWLVWRRWRCLKDDSPRAATATAEEKWEGAEGSSSPSSLFARQPNPEAQYESGGVELQ